MQLRISCRHLESLQSLAQVILHFFTCGKAGSSNSKIFSEGNVWEYSICISFIVEVNQNTQGTQREFSNKWSKFYFSSQPQVYELSHLHKEQHTCLQDLDSQLLLMDVSFQHLFEKQINSAPLLTVSIEQQLVCSTAHTLPSWQEPPAFSS